MPQAGRPGPRPSVTVIIFPGCAFCAGRGSSGAVSRDVSPKPQIRLVSPGGPSSSPLSTGRLVSSSPAANSQGGGRPWGRRRRRGRFCPVTCDACFCQTGTTQDTCGPCDRAGGLAADIGTRRDIGAGYQRGMSGFSRVTSLPNVGERRGGCVSQAHRRLYAGTIIRRARIVYVTGMPGVR